MLFEIYHNQKNKMKKTKLLALLYILPCLAFGEESKKTSLLFSPAFPATVYIVDGKRKKKAIYNPKIFLEKMDKRVYQTIRSPEQIWSFYQDKFAELEKTKKKRHAYLMYIRSMPIIILMNKFQIADKEFAKDFQKKNSHNTKTFNFTNFQLDAIMESFFQKSYTHADRLILYIMALRSKNYPETSLLNMLENWNLQGQTVYLNEYKDHLNILNKYKEHIHLHLIEKISQSQSEIFTSLLHESVKAKRLQIFKTLLKNPYVDVNALDYNHKTAFHYVTEMEWKISASYMKALSYHPKLNFNIKDLQGMTPLFTMIKANKKNQNSLDQYMQFFMKRKADIDMSAKDYMERVAVLFALENGQTKFARVLRDHGFPFPTNVSHSNSYMTELNHLVLIHYDTQMNLNFFKQNKKFFEDQLEKAKYIVENRTIYNIANEHYTIDILLNSFVGLLQVYENLHHDFVMDVLSSGSQKMLVKNQMETLNTQLIKALYLDDIDFYKKIFSKNKNKKFLNEQLFIYQISLDGHFLEKEILESFSFSRNLIISHNDEAFLNLESDTLLIEAIRANAPKFVELLFSLGSDPTYQTKNLVIRDAVSTTILMGSLFFSSPESKKRHQNVVDLVMDHHLVTKEFLNRRIFFGLNYADIAALEGNLYMLKQMYRKGASVSDQRLWGLDFTVRDLVWNMDYLETFRYLVEKENLRKLKVSKESSEGIKNYKDGMASCKKIFH